MQNVTNLINLLGENYYLDFIIEPYAEEVDYEKHFVLVHYQDKKYYEHSHEYIRVRQNEIINDIKSLFQKSISDIYLEVSKKKNNEIENFLNLNIKAANVKLNILKNDFYIENEKSRYCAILYDDADTQTLETFFSKRDYSSTTTNVEVKSIIQRLNSDNRKNLLPMNESDFFVEFHLQRFKLLSFLPFKLFHIAHRFIVELEKIKELSPVGKLNKAKLNIELSQSGSTMNNKDTYFDKFCELIDDYTILKKSTAIGVMIDLKDCIKKIKSEVLLELQNKTDNRNDYLDFLINEIERRDYINSADISYVQKWLDKYQISIQDIFNTNFGKNEIEHFIDRHYDDMEKFSEEKDKAYALQLDFYNFFCSYYSNELIDYLNSKKEIKTTNTPLKQEQPIKPFKDEYLNVFCNEISDERAVKECCFDLVYEGIIHYVPYLETEVIENLLLLSNDKKDDYLNFTIDKIKKTPFVDKEKINIDKWLKKYNVTIDEFPKFSSKELNHWLGRYYNGYSETPHDLDFILDIQIDFYCYAAMVEANKMIDFLESKRANVNNSTNKIENTDDTENINHLSVNQAVILLDKLGVFTDKSLDNVSNVKKAKLISQLLGRNWKNIKTSIESLEKRQSELGSGYQRDLDKIQKLLDNLE
jgi:hypothetical protein